MEIIKDFSPYPSPPLKPYNVHTQSSQFVKKIKEDFREGFGEKYIILTKKRGFWQKKEDLGGFLPKKEDFGKKRI